MTLQEFYAARFGSDPYSLLEAARDELSELATMAGINWAACADNIQLNPRAGKNVIQNITVAPPKLWKRASKGVWKSTPARNNTKAASATHSSTLSRKGMTKVLGAASPSCSPNTAVNNKEIMRPWSHNLLKNWRVLNARQKPASAAPNSNG